MATLVFGVFGLIIGSFLNVVILRKGARSITGRSSCMSCGYMLHWYDMIPVVSWVILFGRCRKCGSHISIQYPFVEASTAALFALIGIWALPALAYPGIWPLIATYLAMCALLVCITAYDFRHTIIPDEWAYAFALLAFLSQFMIPFSGEFNPLWFMFAGPLAAFPLFLLWFVSGGRWMGLGDAKLALGIGWLLGPTIGVVAVMSSFILGTLILIPWMLVQRALIPPQFSIQGRSDTSVFSKIWMRFMHIFSYRKIGAGLTMKSEVPFGPFLILSCLIFWFAQLYGVQLPLPI